MPHAQQSAFADTSAPSHRARPYIGGQAVLEGVMMRAPTSFAVVVRRKDGSLIVRERGIEDVRRGFAAWPLVRGITALVESLRLGGEALRFSADQFEADLDKDAPAAAAPAKAKAARLTPLSMLTALGMTLFALTTSDPEVPPAPDASAKKKGGASWLMLVFAISVFVALPQTLAAAVNRWFHLGLEVQSPGFQVLTGGFKLFVVVGYLLGIRRIPEIRRVFQFHGAEHKTISTYEAREELTVENARKKTTLHPRCGTTFLVMVALVSILVFMGVGGLLPRIHTGNVVLDNVVFFFEKLPFLVPMVAITFEIQRIFARYFTEGPLRAFLWPGFLVQKITTIEPDDDQLEVALASLRATLFREHGQTGESGDPRSSDDVVFPDFASLSRAEHLRAAA
jgi:uncharacterized protein YqhQ